MPIPIASEQPEITKIIRALKSNPTVVRTFRQGNLFGMLVGAVALLGGFICVLLGLSGSVDWIVDAGGVSSKVVNGSPGVIFAVIGLIVMLKYKPRMMTVLEVKLKRSYPKDNSGSLSVETSIRQESVQTSPAAER